MHKYKLLFLDTEFTGLQQNASLISLALIADSGEEFYAEFTDYVLGGDSGWVKENVIPNLQLGEKSREKRSISMMHIRGCRMEIRGALSIWIAQFGNDHTTLQIWADCPAYDWVLFCELFGGAANIPPAIHYMCMDLATMFCLKEKDPDKDREEYVKGYAVMEGKKHNALYDAKITRACYQKLTG